MCLRHRLRMVWLPGRHRTLTTRSISNSLLQQDNPREGYARCRAQVPRIRSIMNRHHSNVRHQLVDPVGFPSHVSPVPAVDACPSIGVACLRRPLLADVETSPESCGPLVSERPRIRIKSFCEGKRDVVVMRKRLQVREPRLEVLDIASRDLCFRISYPTHLECAFSQGAHAGRR